VALQQTSIWTTAIGVEKFEPVNSVIEATLNAPGVAGGGRRAKQQAAAQAVAAAGVNMQRNPLVCDLPVCICFTGAKNNWRQNLVLVFEA
jgi:uncharacterized Ntn-hydrolase superfamily protein